MEIKEKQLVQLHFLLDRFFEDEATEEDVLNIQQIMQIDPEFQQYYFRYIELKSGLHQLKSLGIDYHSSSNTFDAVLLELAEYERTAPEIEVHVEKPQRELIQKVVYPPQEKWHMSKFSIAFIIMNAAAILFFALFIRFIPPRGKTYAYVSGQYQATFQGTQSDLQVGDGLDDKLIKLEKGLLEIRMNDGSEVLFEAPAELSLEDDDQLFLIQGKLTAYVPKNAVGFTVRTPSASIIDYGTEFGVKVDQYAETEAHVLKGTIKVGVGSNPRILEETLRLSSNQSARVSGQTLKEIPSETSQFVYNIPSHFEHTATSLGASMYLCLQSDSIASYRDVLGSVATQDIKIKSNLPVVPGPFSRNGVPSYAFRIEGSDSAIEVWNTQSIPQSPEGDYSIGCWIRLDKIRQQNIYSGCVNSKALGFRLRTMMMQDDGTMRHYSHNLALSGTAWSISDVESLYPGQWYFVMVTREAGSNSRKDLYINGKRVASKSMVETKPKIETFDSFQFGGDVGSCSGFEGELADILLFSKVLSEKEVKRLYESAIEKR